jgi:hypothetical protein
MTNGPNPTSAANGAFASPPAGFDLDKLEAALESLDFEDVAAVINTLLVTYTPVPDQKAEFFTCLYDALTDYDLTLSTSLDDIMDVRNYYETLHALLMQEPALLEYPEGDESALSWQIDEAHIRALPNFDDFDLGEGEAINIISTWRKIIVLHLVRQTPVDGFRQILDETLARDFTNETIKSELQEIAAEIDRHFSAAPQPRPPL